MKLAIFFVEYNQIQQFNNLIPASLRSKTVREFLKEHVNEIDFSCIYDKVGEETISFHLDAASNNKIDMLAAEHKLNRSEVMRAVLVDMIRFYSHYPIEKKKGVKRTFTVAEGTLEHLKGLIAFGERDALIEDFLLNSYNGPIDKSVNELKARPKGSETLLVTLSEESLEKLENFAATIGGKVKRSHIFKDCLEQLIASSEIESMLRLKLENDLTDIVVKLKKISSKKDIKALVDKLL